MRLVSVLTRSPDRVDPFCAYFGRCGGCAIQHWRPDNYHAWKRQLVVDALARAGIDCPVGEVIDSTED